MKLLNTVDLTANQMSNQTNIWWDNILQGTLQASKRCRFDQGAKLDVIFDNSEGTGEGAVDDGGPTREYLQLLMRAIQHSNMMGLRKIFECLFIKSLFFSSWDRTVWTGVAVAQEVERVFH